MSVGLGLSVAGFRPAPLHGQSGLAPRVESGAAECCLVLLLPVGARSVALGRALTAAGAADAVFANPAGLASLAKGSFVIHRNTLAAEASAFSLLLTPREVGTIGLSYQLVDFGEIEQTDENGQTTGGLTIRHHLVIASFATQVVKGLGAGLNYKVYQFRVGCRGTCLEDDLTATTHAIDVGIDLEPSIVPGLRLGAAAVNIGFPLQVINAEQADPLPTRLRLGAAYDVLRAVAPRSDLELWWTVELIDEWGEPGSPSLSSGLELAVADAVYLRAGYVPGDGVGTGVGVGIGIRFERFMISVAKSFAAGLLEATGDPVQLSFELGF